MHTTNCNWTRIENFMQIHPRQARSGYELIRGGMYLTVALIRYMSVSLQNLFRWLNLGFEQHSPLTHSLTKGITHTAHALCSAVIDFVKHECINCFIAAPNTRRNNEGSHGSVHDFKVYRSLKKSELQNHQRFLSHRFCHVSSWWESAGTLRESKSKNIIIFIIFNLTCRFINVPNILYDVYR